MEEFFYWMGVVFSGVFSLVGFCLIMGLLADHCWKKMQNVYGLMEIMAVWKKHKQNHISHLGKLVKRKRKGREGRENSYAGSSK